jgi:cytochrome P450
MCAVAAFIPPRPPPPAAPLSFFAFLRALRGNALRMWPEAAYEENVLRRALLGRAILLVNHPDIIRHVLIDNADNYVRTHATLRILRPITGDGLLLSTGDAWRHQRRTIAPALAPRMLPVLTRHMADVAAETIARLRAQSDGAVDLLATVQTLALEIAGRSMF